MDKSSHIEKLTYGFIGMDPKEAYFKPKVDKLMMSLCSDSTISEDINKTAHPDESVLKIFRDRFHQDGVMIDNFSNITCEWKSISGCVGYVLGYTLKSSNECVTTDIICGGM